MACSHGEIFGLRRDISQLHYPAASEKIAKRYIFGIGCVVAGWADLLVRNHDVFGVTIQNWMVIPVVMVLAAIIWSAGKIGQTN